MLFLPSLPVEKICWGKPRNLEKRKEIQGYFLPLIISEPCGIGSSFWV